MGRPVRTYGTQRRHYTPGSSQVFGVSPETIAVSSSTRSAVRLSPDALESWPEVLETLDEIRQELTRPEKAKTQAEESEDETEADSSESEEEQESTGSSESEDDEDSNGSEDEEPSSESRDDVGTFDSSERAGGTETESESDHDTSYGEPAPNHLAVLADAYELDRGTPLFMSTWPEILPSSAEVWKIAEASFAEVYRVTTDAGSSIIKVLQLKIPTDPASSDIGTAINAADLVSEIRIMNVLTEVPGFVGFKDAHLIKGRFAPSLEEAFYEYIADDGEYEPRETHFPDPEIFTEESMFLVLELADAGDVLEDVAIENIDQVWDVFLGVCMALSRAEYLCEFEHRDLHENNVCVRHTNPTRKSKTRDGVLKFGFSDYGITIIDYGLSRAKLENGDIVYQDLENDLEVFQSSGTGLPGMQFDNYRRMRNYLLTGTRTMQPASFHTIPITSLPSSETHNHTWKDHIPYSNVLWIRYILSFLTKQLKKHSPGSKIKKDLVTFEAEIKDMKRRLDVRTKVENGAFESACQVLDYVFLKGWVSEEQLGGAGLDSTILSQ
ncbi:uncharacterized protein RCO7_09304 [Rhynchosporium graminicola]|uniref:non-specific serine/threonine protein kinase n=1 Tax=Rhynchosporium graminicola TaxID=2792576 RepID=A0A1E1LSM2_9HELO|nr:uncharacterized protein RCO7_09304 [Rhynchosporium commune]